MTLLQFLQKRLIWSIPAFMLLGLAFGAWFDAHALKSTILPLTFVMVYPMMVNLNIRKIFTRGDTRVQVSFRFWALDWEKCFFPGSRWCSWDCCSLHCCLPRE